MKSNTIISAWDAVNPTETARARMLGNISERVAEPRPKMRFLRPAVLAPIAAGLAIAAVITLLPQRKYIALPNAVGQVRAYYVDDAPITERSYSLIALTMEEIFNEWSTDAFRATVLELNNIAVDFGGEKDYRALVTLKVGEVYRGDLAEGEVIEVLSYFPLDIKVGCGNDVLENLRVGQTGIFLPRRYTGDEIEWVGSSENTLRVRDIAEFGFTDGERFAFLEADGGLIFDRETFSGISGAETLDEVAEYIASYTADVTQWKSA